MSRLYDSRANAQRLILGPLIAWRNNTRESAKHEAAQSMTFPACHELLAHD